ncbi:RICIN domain-containing protein [Actinoallomurus sp. NPDC052274]|uniref:RICIN domain-containing protein n=1 Tax=Actinoallomurus sp. NPDC052274 TaxID=3155420 RepID=UPI0034284EF7
MHSKAAALPKGAKSSAASGVVIKNVMTGMCVDIPDFGRGTIDGRVQQHTCDGSSADNQRWDLVVGQKGAGPNGADLFTIRNTKDGYCLDLPDYGTANGADVTEWYCDPGPGDNQMWYLERKSSGEYWIRNVKSPGDECLDVAGPSRHVMPVDAPPASRRFPTSSARADRRGSSDTPRWLITAGAVAAPGAVGILALAVLTREVGNAAGGWEAAECGVAAVVIVGVQPLR